MGPRRRAGRLEAGGTVIWSRPGERGRRGHCRMVVVLTDVDGGFWRDLADEPPQHPEPCLNDSAKIVARGLREGVRRIWPLSRESRKDLSSPCGTPDGRARPPRTAPGRGGRRPCPLWAPGKPCVHPVDRLGAQARRGWKGPANAHPPRCHRRLHGFTNQYSRIPWDDVDVTILGGASDAAKGHRLHPIQQRRVALRAVAVLQRHCGAGHLQRHVAIAR